MPALKRRIAAAAGWLLYGISLLMLVPGALLIAIHETVSGLLSGLLIVAVLAIPAVRVVARRWSAVFRRTATLGLLGLVLTLTVAVFALAPPGTAVPGAGVRSGVPRGQEYRQHRLWNLLPEIDQVKLAITLAPFFDPVIDRAQARRILGWTLPLYREMEARPEFERLGSILNLAYADFLGLPGTGVRHYWLVQPVPGEGGRPPAVVFLHGAAGNFKVYPWLWSRFLEKRPVVAACPTFGFGNWGRPGGVAAVEQVALDLLKDGAADPDRIYLAALSNGGRALSRSPGGSQVKYRGLIAISAVLEEEVLAAPASAGGWRGKPVLLIHGEKDDRIPVSVARRAAEILEALGARVTLRIHPEGDHFLLFSALDEVLSTIARWMEEVEGR